MTRITVMLLFGGESSEHDISVISAKNVYSAIDTKKYNVLLTYIDKSGRWWLCDNWSDTPEKNKSIQLVAAPGTGYFLTVPNSKAISVDVLFPVLHGKHGEDGSVQGLADTMHIPIVGCGIESSAVCMNKDVTKVILQASDIPVVPWVNVLCTDDYKTAQKAAVRLSAKGPWFVKPSRAGSSVGVTKVDDVNELTKALKLAHLHDETALIEIAVTGRELEVAILGNPPHHKASRVGEIIPGNSFYDYEDKYSKNSSSATSLDAKLPKAIDKIIKEHALRAYAILGCTGLARVDFLLSDDMTPYINEINTLPGFTNISMYPKLWQDKGLTYSELIDKLISLARE